MCAFGAAQRLEPEDLILPATLVDGGVVEVVFELGLATLVAEPVALDALEPALAVVELVPGLLEALPVRPEVELVVLAGGPTGLWFQLFAGLGGCVVVLGEVAGSCWGPPVPAVPLPPLPLGVVVPVLGACGDVAAGAVGAAAPTETPTVRGPEPLGFGAPAWCGGEPAAAPADPGEVEVAVAGAGTLGEAAGNGASVRLRAGRAGGRSAGVVRTSPWPCRPGRASGSPASAK